MNAARHMVDIEMVDVERLGVGYGKTALPVDSEKAVSRAITFVFYRAVAQRGSIIGRLDATIGAGSSVDPVRYSSTAAAQERPSEMAHTTRL